MLSITFSQNDAMDNFVNAHNRLALPEFGPFSILKNTHVVLKLWRIFGFKDRRNILSKTTTFDFCIGYNSLTFFNTLRPRQNGRHFPDDILKWIFLNENIWISIEIPLKFVPKGQINNIPALFQIMAWRRPGDKPLSEPMMVSLLTHIYASLGLNELKHAQPNVPYTCIYLGFSVKLHMRVRIPSFLFYEWLGQT